jgi:adenine-specific DNA-methyltransferase
MSASKILQNLNGLNAAQLKRLLVEQLTRQKLGLYWESDAIARDHALNANVVLPRLMPEWSHGLDKAEALAEGAANLIIEGDNYDSLRLLKSTHAGKIRVIYIDPPYNTGNKDWVYNDRYVGANDRWRHSQWLEFLYRRLQLAKDLLTQDGVIMVSINDENRSRLELLMDEVLPGRRLGSLVWRTRDTTSAKDGNFSDVHEHVLVYAGKEFAFRGREKVPTKYKNPDNDPNGAWNGDPLTLAFDRFDRPNLYYPLHNPLTDTWYPCDENRVWAYATEQLVEDVSTLQAETMEEFVRLGRILFPDVALRPLKSTPKKMQVWEDASRTVVWDSLESLLRAIDNGDVPVTPKRRRPLITRKTPNLDFWVGKRVCFGRPLFKKHWKFLRSHVNPLGSWIARLGEDDDDDVHTLRSPQAGEGTEAIQEIFGSKVFQYPKPPQLIRELLGQATNQSDIVLDFFAGSGTTGQAVLELNSEDGGNRKFILCSSTEVTDKEPEKNLCRDVCAERMRRVIAGSAELSDNRFAYLQLDKIAPGDAPFESDCAHAFQLLTMRLGKVARPVPKADRGVKIIIQSAEQGSMTVLVHRLTQAALDALAALPLSPNPRYGHLRVYSSRPARVREHLERAWGGTDKTVESLSLTKALMQGQIAPRMRRATTATATATEIEGGAQ